MKEMSFVCRICGTQWTAPPLSREELAQATAQQLPVRTVRCPKCGGRNVEQKEERD